MASEQDTLFEDLTFREWHGFLNGFYAGARWGSRQHSYSRERHYWRGGYLLGTGCRYALLFVAFKYFTENND